MKCDRCGQEATVHELRVVNGKKVEKHLCESCAREQGIAVQPQVAEILAKHVLPHAIAASALSVSPAAGTLCRACGTTYSEFRQSGLLGCPECYRAFEAQLGPLLERAHEGGTHHVGKVPARALSRSRLGARADAPDEPLARALQRAERAKRLRAQLEQAIAAEQYERAAEIRDELRRLTDDEPDKPRRRPGKEGASGSP